MKDLLSFRGATGLFILLLFFAGCKKEEETPPEFEGMSFDSEEVMEKLPEGLKNADDEYAQQCVGFIESAVDMSCFIDNLTPPENAQKYSSKSTSSKETWTWTWSYQGETFTFYWTYEEDQTKRYWTMDIQYGSSPAYDYIQAWEMKDGSQGEVRYNFNWVWAMEEECEELPDNLYWTYSWRLESDGSYYFDLYYDSSESGCDYYLHYDIVINPNGSGTIDYYLEEELFYHMEWDSSGNGSWTYYVGDYTMTGTWTAGT